MSIPTTAGVVIIGGGVMGASTAYHLAQLGVKDVLLLERESFFGLGSTGKCAGGVRYQFSTEINIRLSQESLPMLERFEEEIGQAVDYHQCGYLFLLTREPDVAAFEQNVRLQHALGVNTEWLDGDEVRARLPLMALDDVLAGTFYGKDGLADPNGVVMGYVSAASRLGARALNDVEVTRILERDGVIRGVETPQGIIEAPIVVNAAGAWAAPLSATIGVELPIEPLRRQVLTTTTLPQLPPDLPMVVDFAQTLYMHREGRGLLVGMSNPDMLPGFEQTVDSEWQLVQMEAAAERMPLLMEAGLASSWAGLYEVTPDHHPIIDRLPPEGGYVVAGFSGHGFMHGPIAGKLMAELIAHGRAETVDISELGLGRFAAGRLIHERNII